MSNPPKKFLWALIALLALTALLAARPRRPGPPLTLTVQGVASWEFDPYECEDPLILVKHRGIATMETAVITLENVSSSAVEMNFTHPGIPDFRPIGFANGYHHVKPLFCGMGLEFGACEPEYQKTWALNLDPGQPRELGFTLWNNLKRRQTFLEQKLREWSYTLRFAPDYQNMVTTGPLPTPAPIPDSAVSFPTTADLRQWASLGGSLWAAEFRECQAIRIGDLERMGSLELLLQLADDMERSRKTGHTHCAQDIHRTAKRMHALVVLDAQGQARAVLLTTPDSHDRNCSLSPVFPSDRSTPHVPAVLPVRHQSCGDYLVIHPFDVDRFRGSQNQVYLHAPCLIAHWLGREDEEL